MTIVLGNRPVKLQTNLEHSREARIRHFVDGTPAESVAEAMVAPYAPAPGSPRPVPVSEIRGAHRGIYTGARRRRSVPQDGVVGLYASRLDAQAARRLNQVEITPVSPLKSVGRGSARHYETLYPSKNIQLPSINVEVKVDLSGSKARVTGTLKRLNPVPMMRMMMSGLTLSQTHRLANSRRALVASMATLMLMAGMATSTFAVEEMDVQSGDVAAEVGFGVAERYPSSWTLDGDSLPAADESPIKETGLSRVSSPN